MTGFLALVFLLVPFGQQPSQPVSPFQLAHRPVDWIGKRVTVCGETFRQPRGQLQVWVTRKGESRAVDVDEAIKGERVGAATCFDGYFRRRDGLTAEDIRRRGFVEGVTDMASNPYYILSAE